MSRHRKQRNQALITDALASLVGSLSKIKAFQFPCSNVISLLLWVILKPSVSESTKKKMNDQQSFEIVQYMQIAKLRSGSIIMYVCLKRFDSKSLQSSQTVLERPQPGTSPTGVIRSGCTVHTRWSRRVIGEGRGCLHEENTRAVRCLQKIIIESPVGSMQKCLKMTVEVFQSRRSQGHKQSSEASVRTLMKIRVRSLLEKMQLQNEQQ